VFLSNEPDIVVFRAVSAARRPTRPAYRDRFARRTEPALFEAKLLACRPLPCASAETS